MATEIELLTEISQKLTELTAMIGLKSSDKTEQVKYLIGYNLSISTISRLTGVPEGTIGYIRAEIQKKRKIRANKEKK